MRFGFNYGVGAGSSRYRNSYLISYLMDTIYTDSAMDRFLDNVGSNGSNNDALALASNHIYLNGTTQSIPYTITSGIEVCYYDVTTKAFVKDTVSNPYTMTTSHSSLFSSTITITDADLAELTADTNKLYRIWLGSETLESGFDKTNIGNFYGGTEGLTSGAYVQDLSVALGTTQIVAPIMTSNTAPFGVCSSSGANVSFPEWLGFNRTANGSSDFTLINIIGGTNATWLQYEATTIFIANSVYLHPRDLVDTFDRMPNDFIVQGSNDGINFTTLLTKTGVTWVDFVGQTFDIPISLPSKYFRLAFTTTIKGNEANIGRLEFTGQEVTAIEIEAYDSATRTTLDNQSNGASNLKLIQDGSGRTTGIAVANTTQWKADGRTAVTNWTITAPFTITEEIDGDTYDFTSDGNRYKNTVADGTYTLPTGVWTLDEFGFDGVTPVAVRGKTSLVDAVVIP